MPRNQSSPLIDARMNVMTILNQKPAQFTRDMALVLINHLEKSLGASDGKTTHLSPSELDLGWKIMKKLAKFIRQQGSKVDEMRGRIRSLEASLSLEKKARDILENRFVALEQSVVNTSAFLEAFDLIKLFRHYHLPRLHWVTVTKEYRAKKEMFENRKIDKSEFKEFKKTFNVKYPTPCDTPSLSDIIDICQERHLEAHSGQIKTIMKQEEFLDDCEVYFRQHLISESTLSVCFPTLQKMLSSKSARELKGLWLFGKDGIVYFIRPVMESKTGFRKPFTHILVESEIITSSAVYQFHHFFQRLIFWVQNLSYFQICNLGIQSSPPILTVDGNTKLSLMLRIQMIFYQGYPVHHEKHQYYFIHLRICVIE